MKIRVLLVDDHEQWCRYVASVLRENPSYQVIAEVADGLEAVRSVEKLKPDLVLLDVGLPTLNGIEVARRILPLSPHSHILFLSEHRAWDIAEAALRTGADGYLIKAEAGHELLPAMSAVMRGVPFVSAGVTGREIRAVDKPRSACDPHRHRLHTAEFCSDETQLLDGYHRFLASALAVGSAAIVIASAARLKTLHQRLRAGGSDVDLAVAEGRFVPLDVQDILARFMVDDWPDEARFWKSATALYEATARTSKATDGEPLVAACGDGTATLWESGNATAAIRLEFLWDEFAKSHDIDVLCGYVLTAVPPIEETRVFRRVCAMHQTVHSR
jgi:DNA-binding NarL/FixJ family response regulator